MFPPAGPAECPLCGRQGPGGLAVSEMTASMNTAVNTAMFIMRATLCKTRCSISCSTAGIEVQTNSGDEEEQIPEIENEITNEEYALIEFFPMFIVKE
ncbi:hypothetical protein NDU88_007446 [Pleurodeles waltl]|uniref:Uncharacterized protein n=1 Tax=Pleurodeles waltl TaxID=8319 RepID=A0AAV7N230_PLEWA|nr:hypothetical protein NDU88_007446 [Pleurodeles waltl]